MTLNEMICPDIRSLVLMSNVFGVSPDILVKGDLEQMKDKIKAEDICKFRRDSRIYAIFLAGVIAFPMPLLWYLKVLGIVKYKKAHDIRTTRKSLPSWKGNDGMNWKRIRKSANVLTRLPCW